MSLGIPRVRRERDPGEPPRWELARARPHPRLAACIDAYVGYWERGDGPLVRRELPGPRVVVILDFGPPLRILDDAGATVHRAGFVAGLAERFTLTEHLGLSQGIQLDVTPIGAHRLTGVPAHQLADGVIGLDAIFGAEGPALVERLQETPTWEARFELLDAFLLARLERARVVPRAIGHAWRRVVDSVGAVTVNELAAELAISRKHLIACFREHVGLTPKLFAQLVRFDAIATRVRTSAGTPLDWARLAADGGYYDQAHLVREVRRFSGYTPVELARHLLPDLGGFG